MFGWNQSVWFGILGGVAMKGAVVLAAAWMAAVILRGRSAAARHLLWTAAFAAILLLPLLSAALPALRLPLAGAVWPSASAVFETTSTASPDNGPATSAARAGWSTAPRSTGWQPNWVMWLALCWLGGSLMAGARLIVGYAAAWRARRSANPLPAGDLTMLARTLGIRRPVEVLQTEPGAMPMTFGLKRATILMPADAAEWSAERRRIVLLHELAHVRRRDAATHLMARAAVAVYWWNPLAWKAWREFLKTRERAADDLVLDTGARASDYAGHLLETARGLRAGGAIEWAAAAMARHSELEGRLLAILDSRVNRRAPNRATVWAVALLAAALIVPLSAVRAQDDHTQGMPADIDASIRVAQSQKNFGVLEAAAQAAVEARKYDAAQKLLEAALAIRAETGGAESVEYGVGLMKMADLLLRSDTDAAAELYAKAARVLGERPEAARALIRLGLAAFEKKDFPPAYEYFQHAQLVDPTHPATPLMWMAIVRQREQQKEEADSLYQRALLAADARPAESSVVMRAYAEFLRMNGRPEEAAGFEARADALQKENGKPESALPAGVFRMGKGVTPPVPILRDEPEYTEEARAARLHGAVVVQVIIDTDGRAHHARVLRSLGLGLDENALDAISQWQFKPAVKDGQPVPVTATIEVNFRLM